ncbi:hypothetical protein [Litorivita sp. NS0012-18]
MQQRPKRARRNTKGNSMSSATVTIFTGFALGLGASALVLLT